MPEHHLSYMEQDGYIGLIMLVGQIDSIGLSLFSYMGQVWDRMNTYD